MVEFFQGDDLTPLGTACGIELLSGYPLVAIIWLVPGMPDRSRIGEPYYMIASRSAVFHVQAIFRAIISVSLVVLSACSPQTPVEDDRLQVMATTSVVADIVHQVGGEFVRGTLYSPWD